MHHIQSSYKKKNNTLDIQLRYRALTSQHQQVGINLKARQPLTKMLLRIYGGQKNPAKRKKIDPFGEQIWQEIWTGTMAQTLRS